MLKKPAYVYDKKWYCYRSILKNKTLFSINGCANKPIGFSDRELEFQKELK